MNQVSGLLPVVFRLKHVAESSLKSLDSIHTQTDPPQEGSTKITEPQSSLESVVGVLKL